MTPWQVLRVVLRPWLLGVAPESPRSLADVAVTRWKGPWGPHGEINGNGDFFTRKTANHGNFTRENADQNLWWFHLNMCRDMQKHREHHGVSTHHAGNLGRFGNSNIRCEATLGVSPVKVMFYHVIYIYICIYTYTHICIYLSIYLSIYIIYTQIAITHNFRG